MEEVMEDIVKIKTEKATITSKQNSLIS